MYSSDEIFESLYQYTHAISIALDHRDHQTRLHSERVSELSVELGQFCELSPWEMSVLRVAASLHDVGKIGVKDAILGKADALDADEWALMKEHSVIGESIILAINTPSAKEASKVIRHHHEHFDGSGYPDGLCGDEIPLSSRIISITDSYDAMAVTRSYHRQRSHDEIMVILAKEAGYKHDPRILEIFRKLIVDSPHRAA